MPTLFDPSALLRVLLEDEQLAPKLATVIRKPAMKAFETALKAKTFTLKDLGRMRRALGSEQFELAVDALPDATLRAGVKRLDPNHPNIVGAAGAIDCTWARKHLAALSTGRTKPREQAKPLDKLLSPKDRTKSKLKALAEKIGPAEFLASLLATRDAGTRSLVKKLDPRHPRTKGKAAEIDAAWARQHLAEEAGLSLPGTQRVEESGAEWFARLQRMYATEAH